MDWVIDEFFDMVPAAAEEPQYLEVPEGEHVFRIHSVETGDRLVVKLAHDDRRYGLVWFKPPAGADWAKRLVAELAKALGMDAAAWRAATPESLKDRRVTARVYHRATDAGKTYVNVGGFSPAPAEAAAAAKPVAKRTATKKADAASPAIPDDDIPF
jgi:hypothetical protein